MVAIWSPEIQENISPSRTCQLSWLVYVPWLQWSVCHLHKTVLMPLCEKTRVQISSLGHTGSPSAAACKVTLLSHIMMRLYDQMWRLNTVLSPSETPSTRMLLVQMSFIAHDLDTRDSIFQTDQHHMSNTVNTGDDHFPMDNSIQTHFLYFSHHFGCFI